MREGREEAKVLASSLFGRGEEGGRGIGTDLEREGREAHLEDLGKRREKKLGFYFPSFFFRLLLLVGRFI